MNKHDKEFYRLMNRAYVRDGDRVYFSGAMLLACLMHTQGESRDSDDAKEVRRIMKDHNLKR